VAPKDYYAILGVARDASIDDIKKAFRSLAMKFHPDRNPNNIAAEQRFRDVAEAYKVLSEPAERRRYDRLGPLYRQDGRPPSPDDLNDFVSQALAGLFRKRRPERGEDIRCSLSVNLEEVASGTQRRVMVNRRVRCEKCSGSGAHPRDGKKDCQHCNGSGRAKTFRLLRSDCPHCDGLGFAVVKTCPRCRGAGQHDSSEELIVKVPRGVATGQKLKLRAKGHIPKGKGNAGDLFVLIDVEEHSLFRRRGANLFCEVPVMFMEASLGTDLVVPTLDGTTRIRVKPGTPSGKVLRLAGRGLVKPEGKGRGDLHVKLNVEVPTDLSSDQKDALNALASSLRPEHHEGRARYERLLKERRKSRDKDAERNQSSTS
jgi:molecular chaperone DnaJ